MKGETPEARRARLGESYRNSGELLVRETRSRLVRFAKTRGLDLAAARDVVQQAYLALFRARPTLADVEAWLTRVVARRSSNWQRRAEVERAHLQAAAAQMTAGETLSDEQRLLVAQILGSLSARARRLVELRYFLGHDEAEAARLAGYSSSSYKKTMTRALRKLRLALDKELVAPPRS